MTAQRRGGERVVPQHHVDADPRQRPDRRGQDRRQDVAFTRRHLDHAAAQHRGGARRTAGRAGAGPASGARRRRRARAPRLGIERVGRDATAADAGAERRRVALDREDVLGNDGRETVGRNPPAAPPGSAVHPAMVGSHRQRPPATAARRSTAARRERSGTGRRPPAGRRGGRERRPALPSRCPADGPTSAR